MTGTVDEVVPLLGELVSPESSDVQIKEAKNSITWQNNATASSRPSENSSVHASGDRPIIREAKFVRHINSASSLQHAEKVPSYRLLVSGFSLWISTWNHYHQRNSSTSL
uniref:Uncharacterized protein n=1 Tax=Timema poppense TaxID=170557 RepID=A0A7R9D2Y5_TIMPO|nr:unnamed protein product [Timema poppensis]